MSKQKSILGGKSKGNGTKLVGIFGDLTQGSGKKLEIGKIFYIEH
jgi:hypothetical protein